ncbi:CoA ester lyase [Rhodanobacter sp. AS-Z3]|uniref:HpcH/HpaI aldolase/citrate lyase family protein n=1 Tax=Rhodanobacter sp. AS-Z3 TaxID=3031330 RepID=UPI00247A0F4F|nr:CoA ester lyase [Rhodanobacter sp. AS-Z3]WEN14115.1 CoA ester lyase [Rhodanobacter sp. AS-Z3]
MSNALINPRRCLMFVPGSRPERYAKAIATDADQVCIDLEDAVAPGDKDSARASVFAFLADAPASRSEIGLRLNPLSTELGQKDLAELKDSGLAPAFVMLPKVESAAELLQADAVLAGRDTLLIAQIETPRGLLDAREIAAATPRLQALMFGGFDFIVALRGRASWESFFHPRVQLAVIAAEAGIGCIDVPFLDIKDEAALVAETDRVIALGFTAKAAIHPAQVGPIQQRYLPTVDELERARRVVAALQANRGEAIQLDGKLVDRPIEIAAERAIALGAHGAREG